MTETFVARAETLAQRAPEMRGHDADGAVRKPWTFRAMAPAGAVVSTLPDMLRFAQALLDDDTLALSTNASWVESGSIRWHNGQTGCHHAMLALDTLKHRAIVALWDAAYDLDAICMHALDASHIVVPLPIECVLSPNELAAYAGTYTYDAHAITVECEDGRLHVRAPLIEGVFYPRGDGKFFSKAVPPFGLTFAVDDASEEAALTITMQGLPFYRAVRAGDSSHD
jgi:hypothetical protein